MLFINNYETSDTQGRRFWKYDVEMVELSKNYSKDLVDQFVLFE